MRAKSILLLDAVGCLLGSLTFLASGNVWARLGQRPDRRLPFALTLTAFGAFLGSSARHERPSSAQLWAAALGNTGWTIACLRLARTATTNLGRFAMCATALADAIMELLQFNASRKVATTT